MAKGLIEQAPCFLNSQLPEVGRARGPHGSLGETTSSLARKYFMHLRVRDGWGERALSHLSGHPFPKCPPWMKLSQGCRQRREFNPGLPRGWQAHSQSCLTGSTLAGNWGQEQSQGSQTCGTGRLYHGLTIEDLMPTPGRPRLQGQL